MKEGWWGFKSSKFLLIFFEKLEKINNNRLEVNLVHGQIKLICCKVRGTSILKEVVSR